MTKKINLINKPISKLFKNKNIVSFIYDGIDKAKQLSEGKYNRLVYDSSFFLILQNSILKNSTDCVFESHKEYIDVHIVIDGRERIELLDVKDVDFPYESSIENDYYLYKSELDSQKYILDKNKIAIFDFHDVHKVGIRTSDKPDSVIKIVLKMKKDKFEEEFINE